MAPPSRATRVNVDGSRRSQSRVPRLVASDERAEEEDRLARSATLALKKRSIGEAIDWGRSRTQRVEKLHIACGQDRGPGNPTEILGNGLLTSKHGRGVRCDQEKR